MQYDAILDWWGADLTVTTGATGSLRDVVKMVPRY
jgi:hypothetical protein